jgi:hypothetical protein
MLYRPFCIRALLLPLVVLRVGAGDCLGQTAAAGPDDRPSGPRESTGLPQVSIIDKLLAAEAMLGGRLKRRGEEAWAAEYRTLYGRLKQSTEPLLGTVKSRPVLAMALGAKGSDGVLALKARDIEALNDCAGQIEKLAARLGVANNYLQRGNIVRHHAGQQRWMEAFLELGFLQQQIMTSFEANPAQKDDAVLVILGGWLQAGRCVTSLISDHYDARASNVLREPKLIELMIRECKRIKPEYQADPVYKQVSDFLPIARKLVDVKMTDAVPKENVTALQEGFDRLVQAVMKPPKS